MFVLTGPAAGIGGVGGRGARKKD